MKIQKKAMREYRMTARIGERERRIADNLLAIRVAENDSQLVRKALEVLGAAHGVVVK
jgi:hypothetical protein